MLKKERKWGVLWGPIDRYIMVSWKSLNKCVHGLFLHLGSKKKAESAESDHEEDEAEVEKQKVKWLKTLRITDGALPEFCKYLEMRLWAELLVP